MYINEKQWTLPLNILLITVGEKVLTYSLRDNRCVYMRQVKLIIAIGCKIKHSK